MAQAGWTVDDLDLVEANQAVAAQAGTVNQAIGWGLDKVNVNGGTVVIGHAMVHQAHGSW